MLTQESALKNIINRLSWLEVYVKNTNIFRLFDINIISEDFFANFFSILYQNQFKNANLFEKNISSIDIVCDNLNISMQVTSDSSSTKIDKTIKGFEAKQYYNKYKTLKFVFLQPKKAYKKSFKSDKFNIELADFSNIYLDIKKSDLDSLLKLEDYVQKSINSKQPENFMSNLSIATEDIKDILDFLHEKEVIQNIELISKENYKEYPGLKEKNNINKLSEDYFENAVLADMPAFKVFESFLKNPRNTIYCDKYYDITTDINNKLLFYQNHFTSFEEAIMNLYELITKKENIKRKKMVYFLLHYMYCNCDIGKSK